MKIFFLLGLLFTLLSGCNFESQRDYIDTNDEIVLTELNFEDIFDYGFNPNSNYGELGYLLNSDDSTSKRPDKITKN